MNPHRTGRMLAYRIGLVLVIIVVTAIVGRWG